jgi:hypothetical protein
VQYFIYIGVYNASQEKCTITGDALNSLPTSLRGFFIDKKGDAAEHANNYKIPARI